MHKSSSGQPIFSSPSTPAPAVVRVVRRPPVLKVKPDERTISRCCPFMRSARPHSTFRRCHRHRVGTIWKDSTIGACKPAREEHTSSGNNIHARNRGGLHCDLRLDRFPYRGLLDIRYGLFRLVHRPDTDSDHRNGVAS